MLIIKTSKGDISIKLDEEKAPKTCENFLRYVREGFYQDTIFHRVIPNFMIQGGGLTADLNTKSTHEPIKNEAKTANSNTRGSVAMARTSAPHSATGQFFINVANNVFLDHTREDAQGYGYCVFAQVVEGMDVVDAIVGVKTGNRQGHGDVPLETITIHEVVEVE